MKVQFANDTQRGRGYACFVCTDVIEPSAKFSFSLCRASDLTFLGKSGWQSAEEKHIPDDRAQENNAAVLYIGPAVVDSLDENENYRLALFADGLSAQKAAFSIVTVNRSFREGQGLVQGVAPSAPPAEEEQPRTPDGPEQQPVEAREEPVVMSPPLAPSNRFPAVLAVTLALLLLLGGGLWWHARQKAKTPPSGRDSVQQAAEAAKTPEDAPEQVPKDALKAEPTLPETQARDGTHQPHAAETKPAPGVREQVRQFLRDEQASAQGAMALYHALSRTPDGAGPETQDSVYRLLYFASRKGDADATLALARCVDPARPVFGTIPKDAREAWVHYAAVV
ncbi:MAG: hypothetical protein LBR94_01480, partial [Desulfovibrio sp.]|nr:hypothetical protein [Desulfovibrio sp.]